MLLTAPIRSARIAAQLFALLAVPALAGRAGAIPCLSGTVRDAGGVAVARGDLDFFQSETGLKLVTPGDNTDVTGFYSVCVLPGLYDVTFAPPPGTRLMGARFDRYDMSDNLPHTLDVTLQTGTVVSGTVRGPAGEALQQVNLAVDRLTGGRVYTPGDKSDTAGAYRIVIPNGGYRFRWEPLPGVALQGVQIDTVLVNADRTIDVQLAAGTLLRGTVRDGGGTGIKKIDLELRDRLSTNKVFVANNTTDVNGDYVVALPPGTWDLRFAPRPGVRFRGVRVDSFVVGSSELRRDLTLETGSFLSADVQDANGAPIAGCNLTVLREPAGEVLYTPNDKTDAAGHSQVVVPNGTYTVRVNPPPGTAFDRVTLTGVVVNGDAGVSAVLPEVQRVRATGRITDANGQGLANVGLEALVLPTRERVTLLTPNTDATGAFDVGIPAGRYDLRLAPGPGMRFLGRVIAGVTVTADSALGSFELEPGVLVTTRVVDPKAAAVPGTDLDFFAAGAGSALYTPNDNTGLNGTAVVAVRPGNYRIVVTPPLESPLRVATLGSVEVRADTLLEVTLGDGGTAPSAPVVLGDPSPNPFTAKATFSYAVRIASDVELTVFNVAGRIVRRLERGPRAARTYVAEWDGRNDAGEVVPSGMYLVRLVTAQSVQTRKTLFVR